MNFLDIHSILNYQTMNTITIFILACVLVVYGYSSKYEEEHHEPSPYAYKYAVEDHHTGDYKTHHEVMENGVVKGYYKLKEADGTFREVHYTADKINGFNAVVKKSGTPIVQPVKPSYKHEYEGNENGNSQGSYNVRHPQYQHYEQ